MDSIFHQEDRKVRVTVEASDFTCEGLVHLPGIRLSDVVNEKGPFLVVTQATVVRARVGADPQRLQLDTVFINKSEIKFMIPIDDRRLTDM